MKKLLALVSVLSISACYTQFNEESAFDNRQYMMNEGKYAAQTHAEVPFHQTKASGQEVFYEQTEVAPSGVKSTSILEGETYVDGPKVEKAPVKKVSKENLPRYEVVEIAQAEETLANDPIPLETVPMAQPMSSMTQGAQTVDTTVTVEGNYPPKVVKKITYKEVESKPRQYKKYKEVYLVDTPQGTVNLWEETVSPEVYEVVATRATNKLLQQTENLYSGTLTPTLYLAAIDGEKDKLDNGFYLSRKVVRDILIGSKAYRLVNKPHEADYNLKLSASKHEIEDGMDKIMEFKLTLYDKNHKPIQTFSELIKQVKNDDQSWW